MSSSQEEEIARDYICFGSPDVTVVVIDATCLERNLNLVYQTMELTPNVIVCVNLLDEAKKKGIFVDLEILDKEARQPNMDTVKSHHKISDIGLVKKTVSKAEILTRVNHIYEGSRQEIDAVIREKTDIIMLPYFKTVDEVKLFLEYVDGRAKTSLLLETPEAVECLDEIIGLPGIDEIHIGLNDLSLGYRKKFMFELLSDGTVEKICAKLRNTQISYGFGGIAGLGQGQLSAEYIIKEHYRLGSKCAILSRSFCNTSIVKDRSQIRNIFENGIKSIREFEKEVKSHWDYFEDNRLSVKSIVKQIVEK